MLKPRITSDACDLIRATAPNPNPLGKEFGLVEKGDKFLPCLVILVLGLLVGQKGLLDWPTSAIQFV